MNCAKREKCNEDKATPLASFLHWAPEKKVMICCLGGGGVVYHDISQRTFILLRQNQCHFSINEIAVILDPLCSKLINKQWSRPLCVPLYLQQLILVSTFLLFHHLSRTILLQTFQLLFSFIFISALDPSLSVSFMHYLLLLKNIVQ